MAEALAAGAEAATGSDARERLLVALRDSGYEPFVEPDGSIRLRNCPFDALVDEHRPLVCGTNLALADGLVHGAAATDYEPVPDQQPGFCCVAFVRKSASSDG